MRLLHGLLAFAPHRAWLYVDDLFAELHRPSAQEQLAVTTIFLQAILAPMSWKKVHIGNLISWCGWQINLDVDTIALAQAKLDKLCTQLSSIYASKKVLRKTLEQTIGLLVWATAINPHMRPHLAPLYRDLHSPPGAMYSVSANRWRNFLDCLAADLAFAKDLPGIFIPKGAMVIEYGGRRLHTKADLPLVPRSSKPQYVRVADPASKTTTLQKDSRECIAWLRNTLEYSPTAPLSDPPCLPCLAAADACAEEDMVGVGGWLITSHAVVWFSEMWSIQDLRLTWPFLTKKAQAYISSFEALAQFILLQAAYHRQHHKHATFCLPTGSDNSAAEATLNTLFSTTWPLCHFLRLAAGWAHRHGVALQVSHLPGELNDWADDLSRDRLERFQHRPAERFRISPAELAQEAARVSLHPTEARWGPEHRELA